MCPPTRARLSPGRLPSRRRKPRNFTNACHTCTTPSPLTTIPHQLIMHDSKPPVHPPHERLWPCTSLSVYQRHPPPSGARRCLSTCASQSLTSLRVPTQVARVVDQGHTYAGMRRMARCYAPAVSHGSGLLAQGLISLTAALPTLPPSGHASPPTFANDPASFIQHTLPAWVPCARVPLQLSRCALHVVPSSVHSSDILQLWPLNIRLVCLSLPVEWPAVQARPRFGRRASRSCWTAGRR